MTELVILEKNESVTGRVYQEKILPVYINAMTNNELIPNPKLATLLQDSAPAHIYKPVLVQIKANFPKVWSKGLWPGNSPDLNVIEHVWNVLQESVFKPPRPNNRQKLIERVKDTWFALDQNYLKKLVESFPLRIHQLIDNNGGHTDY